MKIIPNLLSVNHTKGRDGLKPDAIVVHVMAGTMSGTLSWFRNPRAKVSAHYGVSLLGTVVQYVKDEDTAWANGLVVRPTAAIVKERPGVNPNEYTLSVECEGNGTEPLTPLQRDAVVDLTRTLSARHGIPLTRRHVLRHDEIRADKACPGEIDVDELVRLADDAGAKYSQNIPEPAHDVAEEPLTATVIPPNLERIILPTREHFEEAARVRGLDPSRLSIMDAVEVTEAILRIMVRSGVRQAKPVADVLAEIVKERA